MPKKGLLIAVSLTLLMAMPFSASRAQIKFSGIDDDNWLDFSWTAPSNAGSTVAHYAVYLSQDAGGYILYDTTADTSYSVPGESGHSYRVKVAGVNASGQEGPHSPESDEILCQVPDPDQTPPKSVDQLAAQASDGAVLLTWPEVIQDVTGSPEQISHYIIYRSQEPIFTPQPADSIAGVESTFYLDGNSGIGWAGMNHFYVVTAVDQAGNESQISNRVGEYDYALVPQMSGYHLISPILDDGQIVTVADLGQAVPSCSAVKQWDPQTQSYVSRAFKLGDTWYGDAEIDLGYPYFAFVGAGLESTWSLVGSVPSDPVFVLQAPGGNGYNTITLPLSSTLILAKDLGQAIPHCTAVKQWDPQAQAYVSIAFKVGDLWFGNAPVHRGQPYFVNVTAQGTWPEVKGDAVDGSDLRKRSPSEGMTFHRQEGR